MCEMYKMCSSCTKVWIQSIQISSSSKESWRYIILRDSYEICNCLEQLLRLFGWSVFIPVFPVRLRGTVRSRCLCQDQNWQSLKRRFILQRTSTAPFCNCWEFNQSIIYYGTEEKVLMTVTVGTRKQILSTTLDTGSQFCVQILRSSDWGDVYSTTWREESLTIFQN